MSLLCVLVDQMGAVHGAPAAWAFPLTRRGGSNVFLGGTANGLLRKDQMFFSCYIVTAVARTYNPDPNNLFILASLNCNKRMQRAK